MAGMPYCKCPRCGAVFHLNVGNMVEWYRERWPNLKPNEFAPEICVDCWKREQAAQQPDQSKQHSQD
jgi:hypothetical protein